MNRQKAEKLIAEAKELNGGAWIDHSYNVARLAEKIASKANIDTEKAYIIGLLHDIGRRNGTMQLKRLRKENERLKMENEVLKKAAAYFAKHPADE